MMSSFFTKKYCRAQRSTAQLSIGSSPEERGGATQRDRGACNGLDAAKCYGSIHGACTRVQIPLLSRVVVVKSGIPTWFFEGRKNGCSNPTQKANKIQGRRGILLLSARVN